LIARHKIALAILGVAWIALGVASVAVILTPTDWCNELPTPTGENVTLAALFVAGIAAFVAFWAALDSPVVPWIALATFAAGGGVFWWFIHHQASWACG
jgi:hypothetical protein